MKKKLHSAEINLKGGPFGLVRYCMLREKPFWFSSLGQHVKFGRTILVTSGGLKINLKKHGRKAMTIVGSFQEKRRLKMAEMTPRTFSE